MQTFTVVAATGSDARAWDGVVEAVSSATLTAQTSGRVQAVQVDVNDRVAAGAVLLRLSAVEQQSAASTARAQLRAAAAAAAEAEQNYRRYAALASGQFVSRAQIDQARAARDSAVAARDAAQAGVAQAAQQADYTVVRAPFAGVVSRRLVEPGESVAPGQPLLDMHAPGAMRVEVQVPQSIADQVRAMPRAEVRYGDGRSVEAAGVVVHPQADPVTHSVAVRVLLPQAGEARMPGTTAKVVFPIVAGAAMGPAQAQVRIPASAIVQRGELSAVYVLQGKRLLLRQLRLGERDGDQQDVISGLRAGDVVARDPVAATRAIAEQRRASGAEHE
ncbi:MAG: efflux RND transporter periplasmic adaptor subunit [Pseudoxanthomonas sp.]